MPLNEADLKGILEERLPAGTIIAKCEDRSDGTYPVHRVPPRNTARTAARDGVLKRHAHFLLADTAPSTAVLTTFAPARPSFPFAIASAKKQQGAAPSFSCAS